MGVDEGWMDGGKYDKYPYFLCNFYQIRKQLTL